MTDEQHDDEPGEVLEGEVVVYRDYPGAGYSSGDGRTGPRTRTGGKGFGPRSYDQSLVAEVIAYTITHPHDTLKQIGEKYGVSIETVRRWTREDVSKRSSVVDTPKLRAEAAIGLEAATAEAWKLYDAATGRSARDARMIRTALEALRTVDQLTSARAKLMGLNMPVKIDVALTQLTEAEIALQEMINEAAARASASEADVIAQASDDPDL